MDEKTTKQLARLAVQFANLYNRDDFSLKGIHVGLGNTPEVHISIADLMAIEPSPGQWEFRVRGSEDEYAPYEAWIKIGKVKFFCITTRDQYCEVTSDKYGELLPALPEATDD